ncbi:hypothetical protein SPF06_18590 [Sinomonas sp. JGH33]|uniref:Uncharacterized protein n=1 Tax=Sinomonas terricola TaxID=3110330 RepID=A0ABU5TAL2_9MICC|nr:hypothetical protein [Sinomonas sp. JGH33]MEA5456736.1 hypothetical protein [Sinomonas sp. JGH33]
MHKPQDELFKEGKRLALLRENIDAEHRDRQGRVDDADQLKTRAVIAEPAPDHIP